MHATWDVMKVPLLLRIMRSGYVRRQCSLTQALEGVCLRRGEPGHGMKHVEDAATRTWPSASHSLEHLVLELQRYHREENRELSINCLIAPSHE